MINSTPTLSIKVTLHDGTAEGLREAEFVSRSIKIFAFKRSQLRNIKTRREELEVANELEAPGVYFLIESDDSATNGRRVYVGESGKAIRRLDFHNSDDDHSFWADTVVIVSKDLHDSNRKYVEWRFIDVAWKNLDWAVENKRTSPNEGGLSHGDRNVMDSFVLEAVTLIGTLGYRFLRLETGSRGSPIFKLRHQKNLEARMSLGDQGGFVVKQGSQASRKSSPNMTAYQNLRDELIKRGVLTGNGDSLVFSSEYSFSSPSAAGAVVTGRNSNGRTEWKLDNGRTYGEWDSQSEENIIDTPNDQGSSAVVNSPNPTKFEIIVGDSRATMVPMSSHEFVVLKGSWANPQQSPHLTSYRGLRDELKSKNVLVESDSRLQFTKNFTFASASAAGVAVTGRNTNGLTEWKLPDGTTYGEWRKK